MNENVNNVTAIVVPLIAAFIGSTAVFGFIQFIVQFVFTRNDMKNNFGTKLNEMDAKIDRNHEETNQKIDRNKAELCRTHILRFADDLRNGIHHSEEYFRQQLLDIDTYDSFCKEHPTFSNGLTVIASEYIKNEFIKLYSKEEHNETKKKGETVT